MSASLVVARPLFNCASGALPGIIQKIAKILAIVFTTAFPYLSLKIHSRHKPWWIPDMAVGVRHNSSFLFLFKNSREIFLVY
jgi:hypothetical protein